MPLDLNEVADVTVEVGARLATTALILVAGFVVARIARRVARHLLDHPGINLAVGPSFVRLLYSAVYFLVLALTVALALIALGMSATTVSTVALISLAIVAIALRESIANFAATVSFLMFIPFRRGEMIETMGHLGTVQELLLFNTVLLRVDHRMVTLPNSKIQENGIVNYSRMGRVRVDFSLTVTYDQDVSHVRAVITELAQQDPRILPAPPFEVLVDALAEDGVRLQIFQTVTPEHYWDVPSDLRERIKARFDAEGITFAIPRHEVRMAAVPNNVIHTGASPRAGDR